MIVLLRLFLLNIEYKYWLTVLFVTFLWVIYPTVIRSSTLKEPQQYLHHLIHGLITPVEIV